MNPVSHTGNAPRKWKGFTVARLGAFGIYETPEGVAVPYLTRDGNLYRTKLFPPDGRPRWVGDSKPQIPYGLETLQIGDRAAFLTEGESDAIALRLAFPNTPVLGIPGASSWRTEWRSYVDGYPVLYLSFDADDAGRGLADAVLRDIPHARLVDLPAGSDTRDVLQRLGRADYRTLLENATARAALTRALHECMESGNRRAAVDRRWQQHAEQMELA